MAYAGAATRLGLVVGRGQRQRPQMGNCRHCGKDAGWFRDSHEQCEAQYGAVKKATLEDASRGIVPQRFQSATALPMALAPGESLVWGFQAARYMELQRQRRGGHSYGLSARVARGFWYSERLYQAPQYDYGNVELGVGMLLVTDRGLRFRSADGTIVLDHPFSKIDDVTVFTNGVGVHLQSRSTKPQQSTFIVRDGEFAGQLVWRLWQERRG